MKQTGHFFAYRLSEIDMFTTFVQSTPDDVDFYGTTLLQQSLIAIIPRVFWPEKPITEDLVMERVYNAGVANRLSNVSAKPAYVVDTYLSGGGLGVFIGFVCLRGNCATDLNKSRKPFWWLHPGLGINFQRLVPDTLAWLKL